MNNYRHLLLAWSLMVSILAAFAVGAWLPLTGKVQQNEDRIESLRERIAKIGNLKSTQSRLAQELDVMRNAEALADSSRFIVARSPTLGTAELQRRIQAIIVAQGARQISSQPLGGTDAAGFYKLEVVVNLSGGLPAIKRVLFALEYGQPRIFVDKLLIATRVRRNRVRLRAADQAAAATTELTVRLSASAYMQHAAETDVSVAER